MAKKSYVNWNTGEVYSNDQASPRDVEPEADRETTRTVLETFADASWVPAYAGRALTLPEPVGTVDRLKVVRGLSANGQRVLERPARKDPLDVAFHLDPDSDVGIGPSGEAYIIQG